VNSESLPVDFFEEEQELITVGKMDTAPMAIPLCKDVFRKDLLVAIKKNFNKGNLN
jgi:hypothetical protein